MVIDHIGLFFFPENFLFRTIGRIAFPLFAWLIANGAYHTKNINKYLYRLLAFAFISQIPFMMTNRLIDPSSVALNIFFTLSIGLVAILFIKKTPMKIHWVLISAVCAALATALGTDYGGFGVLSIVAFYIYFKNMKAMLISQIWIYVLMSLYFLYQGNALGLVEIFGLLALLAIAFYNDKEGPKMQYLFYLFYPVHYALIYLVLTLF
jgi:hypothetical protein